MAQLLKLKEIQEHRLKIYHTILTRPSQTADLKTEENVLSTGCKQSAFLSANEPLD